MSAILFTYITPFHPLKGGIGRATDTLAREFLRRGHEVHYLIYRSAITVEHSFDYPAPLHYLPSGELMSAENISFYHRYLSEHHIDFVINQSGNFGDSELWLTAHEMNVKVISVLHSEPLVAYRHLWNDFIPLRNQSFKERLKQLARIAIYVRYKRQYRQQRMKHFATLLPHTDVVCTLSSRYFSQLDELCPGYREKYCAIPNPNSYPEESIRPVAAYKKRNLIIVVGLLVRNKRVDRVIRIWKRICTQFSNWELVIIGDGAAPYVQYLKRLASGCKNLTFTGMADPKPYYEAAKIICHSSNYEGWGLVLTEAMQHGVVPVSFDASDVTKDILCDGKAGILVSSYNLKNFERSLMHLMSDEDLTKQLSISAQQYVKRFNISAVADMWEDLFHSMEKKPHNIR